MADWAAGAATSRGNRSGQVSPIEDGGSSFSFTEERRASQQQLSAQRGLVRRLCTRRVAIPFLLTTLVTLAVLVAWNNSLAAAEQPSTRDAWARVTPAGTRVTTNTAALGGATSHLPLGMSIQQETQPAQVGASQSGIPQQSAQKCVSVRTCLRNEDPNVPRFACWAVARSVSRASLSLTHAYSLPLPLPLPLSLCLSHARALTRPHSRVLRSHSLSCVRPCSRAPVEH